MTTKAEFHRALLEKSPSGPHFVIVRDHDDNKVTETLFIEDQEDPAGWLVNERYELLEQFPELRMVRVRKKI